MARTATLATLAALLGACGGDDASTPDTGLVVDAGAADAVLLPPDIPWLSDGVPPVALAPCPEGWREVDRRVVECEPYPDDGPATCGPGEAHFPGEPGCRPLGSACPSGDYAEDLPASGVLYVQAGPTGGDGSMGAPFGSLDEVPWATLSPGDTVALSKGRFAGTIPLRAGVRLVGACAAETILEGASPPLAILISVQNGGEAAVVRELTIDHPMQNALVVPGGRSLEVEAVAVNTPLGRGLYVDGPDAEVSLRDVVIRETTESTSVGGRGRGIVIDGGGVRLDAQRVILDANVGYGLAAIGDDIELTLTDALVRDTQPSGAGNNGFGVFVQGARSEVTLSRVVIDGNHDVGVVAKGAGAVITLTDSIVRNTRSLQSSRVHGRGINAQEASRVVAERVVVAGNRAEAIFAVEEGTEVLLSDVVIRDTLAEEADGTGGFGVFGGEGAVIRVTRGVLSGNRDVAILAGTEAQVFLEDAAIYDTLPAENDGLGGRGALIGLSGSVMIRRVLMAENHDLGLLVDGASGDVEDLVVRDPVGTAEDPLLGAGVHVQEGGSLRGARVRIENAHTLGLGAVNEATLDLSDVSVGMVASVCAATSCPDTPFGYGLVAGASDLSLSRFEIVGSSLCGMLLTTTSSDQMLSTRFEDGLVAGSPLGLCVQVAGADLDVIARGVRFRDNETNLDATTLPVPGAPAFGGIDVTP